MTAGEAEREGGEPGGEAGFEAAVEEEEASVGDANLWRETVCLREWRGFWGVAGMEEIEQAREREEGGEGERGAAPPDVGEKRGGEQAGGDGAEASKEVEQSERRASVSGPAAAGEDVGGGYDFAEAEPGKEEGWKCEGEAGREGEGGKTDRC